MKTRAEKIATGRVWHVYRDAEPDNTLFEGSKTACLKWLRNDPRGYWYAFRRGEIRIGKVIWEADLAADVVQ